MLAVWQQIVATDGEITSIIVKSEYQVYDTKNQQLVRSRSAVLLGPWSKEEEEKLSQIVTEMTVAQGKDQDNEVFWGQVAERMGNKRGRQQCRIKW